MGNSGLKRVLVIAAMPGELLHLARGWKHEKRDGRVHLWRMTQGDAEWVAACAGAGQAAATRAFAEVEKDGPVSAAISAGWVGALSAEFVPGRVYAVAGVIDARTGERFEAGESVLANGGLPRKPGSWRPQAGRKGSREGLPSGAKAPGESTEVMYGLKPVPFSKGSNSASSETSADVARISGAAEAVRLQNGEKGAEGVRAEAPARQPSTHQLKPWVVTSPIVAGREEKRRLAAAYSAGLVDMEAAAVARLAAMRNIPFYCIKAVSDGHTARLPDFNRFVTAEGQFQLARFVFFSILRPWHWPELIRMSENSSKASQALRDSLLENLRRPGAY